MASKKERELAKEYVKRSIRMNQAFETFGNHIAGKLKKLHEDVMKKIEKELGDSLTSKKIADLSQQLKDDIVNFYNEDIIPSVDEAFVTVVGREMAWNGQILASYARYEGVARLNPSSVAKKAMSKSFQGHTFKNWFNSSKQSDWVKISKALKEGYVHGQTTPQIVNKIKLLSNQSSNDIKTLTRSYLSSAAQSARLATMEDADVVLGYIWESILDARTTPTICGVRDGKKYDKEFQPIGHDLSWSDGPGRIHFNCRSNFVPLIEDMENIGELFTRPSVEAGKNYESGDNLTAKGKVRKATRANTEKGIFKIKQVPGGTNYEQWLRTQKKDYVNDIIKNKQYAEDFMAGRLSLGQIAKYNETSITDL